MNEILIVTFDNLTQARKAMSDLRRLADDGVISIRNAAIVVREADGRFWMPEDEEHVGFTGLAAGGAIGALVGALVGPIGLLVGGATGALVGSLVDAQEAEGSEDVLASVTRQVPPGTTVLVADLDEPSRQVVDTAMVAEGGRIVRHPRADIEAEVAATEEAVQAARRAAERVLHERRKGIGEQTLGDKLSEAKERLTSRR